MTNLNYHRLYMLETTLAYIQARIDRPDFNFMDVWNPVHLNMINDSFVEEHGKPPAGWKG